VINQVLWQVVSYQHYDFLWKHEFLYMWFKWTGYNISAPLFWTILYIVQTHKHRRTRRGKRPTPQAWKISGQTRFSGQAQVNQKSWLIKHISLQWKIPGQLCFSGQAQVAQNSWM